MNRPTIRESIFEIILNRWKNGCVASEATSDILSKFVVRRRGAGKTSCCGGYPHCPKDGRRAVGRKERA